MAKENKTHYIILGLLNHENLSGYDLKKKIDTMIDHFWSVGYGQIYPALKALEENAFIQSLKQEQDKGPEKTIFQITPAGKTYLRSWLIESDVKDNLKFDILLHLFFGGLVSDDINLKRLEEYKAVQEEKLQEIRGFKGSLEHIIADDVDHLYFYLSVLMGEKIYKASQEWAIEAIDLIQKKTYK